MGLGNVYMHYIPQKVKKNKRFRITKHYIIIYENIDPIWKQNGFQNKKSVINTFKNNFGRRNAFGQYFSHHISRKMVKNTNIQNYIRFILRVYRKFIVKYV